VKRLLMLTLMCVLATVWVSQSAAAAEKLVRVAPKTINFGTVPVDTTVLKGATITNVSGSDVLLLVEGGLPDDFGFGLLPGSTCPALTPDILAAGARCDVVVRFTPTETFAGERQTSTLTATLWDPATGELLATISIPIVGRGVLTG
jgi:hypothetical protein